MDDHEFDRALVTAAFELAARDGWGAASVAAAAREGGLAMDRARERFPTRNTVLAKFGRIADQLALSDTLDTGSPRERLFDVVMRRFDALQQHREGVLALLAALPGEPLTALLLAAATRASMGWMLEGAGLATTGLRGQLAAQGLVGVWLYTLRAWRTDDSPDLSGTMAALDRALARAEQLASMLGGAATPEPSPKPFPEPAPFPDDALLAGAAAADGAASFAGRPEEPAL